MRLVGKLVGGVLGFALTRHPLGLVVGAALGHAWDEGWLRGLLPLTSPREGALVEPLFALAGAVAKADGRVSEAEVAATEALLHRMGVVGRARAEAIRAFERGKGADFDVHLAARDLRAFCGFRGELKLMLVEVLADVAVADGALDPAAEQLLRRIAWSLDLAESTLLLVLARKRGGAGAARAAPIADPWGALGLTPAASDGEIRRAYRRLIAQYHPDKLQARGADAEAIRQAEERAREINAAWERLRELRGIK